MRRPGVPEDALERAGTLLMVAGFLAALVAGTAGLEAGDAVTVVLAVALLVGYGVAGWLLIGLGQRALETAALFAVVATLATFGLLGDVGNTVGSGFANLFLFPLLVLLLAYAGGGIAGYAVARSAERMDWAIRGSDQANLLMHAAAAPTVWAVFMTLESLGGRIPPLVASLAIALAGGVALVASAGGRLVRYGVHPRYLVAASGLTLAVNGWFLLEFARLDARFVEGLSGAQWVALLAMLLAAFPVAFSAVALHDVRLEEDGALERTRPL